MQIGIWIGIAILAIIAVLLYWNWRRKKDTQDPPTSLVLLLAQPRTLSTADISDVISSACNIRFDLDNKEAQYFVLELPRSTALVGENGRSFLVKIPQGSFMIHCASIPYEDSNDESFVQTIRDGRLQRVFREHHGWLSCDVMQLSPEDQPDTAGYAIIGRIIAHFTGEDTLGIFCPALLRCSEYSQELQPALLSGNPLTIFEQTTNIPVIHVQNDDPELIAAMEEARRRWPEFVAAFNKHKPSEDHFSVKAPFTEDGITEWIWVSPSRVSETAVTGSLDNIPNELKRIKYGDQVTFPADQIGDWVYYDEGNIVGGFSIKVMQRAMEKEP